MTGPALNSLHVNRRQAMRTAGASAAVAASGPGLSNAAPATNRTAEDPKRATSGFWPNGARVAVSLSLMFEGGGQPISGAGGVIPHLLIMSLQHTHKRPIGFRTRIPACKIDEPSHRCGPS